MCNCGIGMFELIFEKLYLGTYSVYSFFGVDKEGISTMERLLRFMIMVVALTLLVYIIILVIGTL